MTISEALDCTLTHLMLMAKAHRAREASRALTFAQAVHFGAAACMSDRGGDAFSDFQRALLDQMKD